MDYTSLNAMDEALFDINEVRKLPGNDACWLYIGRASTINLQLEDGRLLTLTPQEFMWRMYRGEQEQGVHVRSGCGNVRCVRPSHLHSGAKQELPILLKPREVAALTGMNVYAVMKAIRAGTLPGIYFSKRVGYRVPLAALLQVGVA